MDSPYAQLMDFQQFKTDFSNTAMPKEIIARFFSHGKRFEVLLDADKYVAYKEGKIADMREILISDGVFRDIGKVRTKERALMAESVGVLERVPNEELQKVFGTSEFLAVAKKIVDEGEVQITAEQRRELLEKKIKRIVTFISQQAIDPRTGAPHPPARIETAMEQAKVRVDPFRKAEEQVADIIKALQPILPIKIERRRIALKVEIQYASGAKRIVAAFGTIQREQWTTDRWFCEVEIPAGMQEKLFSDLNAITHGTVESRIVEKK